MEAQYSTPTSTADSQKEGRLKVGVDTKRKKLKSIVRENMGNAIKKVGSTLSSVKKNSGNILREAINSNNKTNKGILY